MVIAHYEHLNYQNVIHHIIYGKNFGVMNVLKVSILQHFIQNIITIQKNRMEKLLQSCAGFVKCKYGCKNDVIDLKWLLLEERTDSSILKLVYNGRNKEDMPVNLKLKPEQREITRCNIKQY